MGEPTLVVHGHFYQPPRENPWTEEVSAEMSAAPFHDWNERITAECYRPNGWARVLDDRGRVRRIVSNYVYMSFDAGPTLLSWLERHQPDVLERMVEADRVGGGAIALGYNHIILPLANERDVRTQIRWGLADFQHRFGRRAEGFWLPETAVNDTVLRLLAEEGVGFTILAPNQIVATRPFGGEWNEAPVDTKQTYRWSEGDLSVGIVVYDGDLSHDVAFSLDRLPSEDLVHRAKAAAGDDGLACVATDGETFGHHHRWAERALAFLFSDAAASAGLRVSSAAAVLRDRPPVAQVRVRESAWSCAHGVERWRSDCGCHTGGDPGWHQAWRGPLRDALDILRDAGAEVFERRGGSVLRDPWGARDAYVGVLLGTREVDDFLDEHMLPNKTDDDRVVARTLLEAQRNALLMYTSCGWFFNDLAGIETIQVLRYAARSIDLLDEIDERPPVDEVLERLAGARSNRSDEGDGRDIWRRHVESARVDAPRVVAHLALVELLDDQDPPSTLGGYDLESHERRTRERGALTGAAGLVVLRHRRTGRPSAHVYAAMRLGGLEVYGATRPANPDIDSDLFVALNDAVASGERVTTMLRIITEGFGPREFGLESALPDAAGEIVAGAATALANRFAAAYDELYDDHRTTFAALAGAGYVLPPGLYEPAAMALARRLENEIATSVATADVDAFRNAREIVREARRLGIHLATPEAAGTMGRDLLAAVDRAVTEASADRLSAALSLAQLIADLDLDVDRDRAQELLYDALQGDGPVARTLKPLAAALGLAV